MAHRSWHSLPIWVVITSYSIHYTKLYDLFSLCSMLLTQRTTDSAHEPTTWSRHLNTPGLPPDSFGSHRVNLQRSSTRDVGQWPYGLVITSYSIHYTKLYEAPNQQKTGRAPFDPNLSSSPPREKKLRSAHLINQIPTALPNHYHNHRISAQSVVIFWAYVVDAADSHIIFGLFNGIT